jgi:cytochrome c-type biogenesis protein CcmE
MKKSYILGIIIIALAIGAMISSLSDSSTYADFSEAESNPGKEFHVVGTHAKEKESLYEPEKNPDLFTFYMNDNNGVERKVYLHKSKPQDFERSEQIVLIGKSVEGEFHASDILMKCPSKYNDGVPQATAQNQES